MGGDQRGKTKRHTKPKRNTAPESPPQRETRSHAYTATGAPRESRIPKRIRKNTILTENRLKEDVLALKKLHNPHNHRRSVDVGGSPTGTPLTNDSRRRLK